MNRRYRSDAEREVAFWQHVDKTAPSGCWIFTGATDRQGYGRFHYRNFVWYAHRLAYELAVGPIPEGRQLDHVCHNKAETCRHGRSCPHRSCVNPAHLEPVSGTTNQQRQRRTTCRQGHPFDKEFTRKNGYRQQYCATCQAQRNRASERRRRERCGIEPAKSSGRAA